MNIQPSPTPEAFSSDPSPIGGEGGPAAETVDPGLLARLRAFEAHQAAFRRELFSLPGAAHALLQRWAALHREGRPAGVLAAHFGDGHGRDWDRHVDSHLVRVARLVAEHEPRIRDRSDQGRRRRARLEDEIERVLSSAGVSLTVAIGIHDELRLLAAAPRCRETLEQRRRAGLTTPIGRLRLSRAGRALARLDVLRRTIASDHLDLVDELSRCYRDRGVGHLELVEAGTVALMEAVETFDYRGGTSFDEHAGARIERALAKAVRNRPRAA